MVSKIAIVSQREFADGNQQSWAHGAMLAAIVRARKKGYDEFMIRCAPGLEMTLAQVVLDTPETKLIMTHPYENFGLAWKRWRREELENLARLEEEASGKLYVDEIMYKNGRRTSWDRGSHSMDKYIVCCEWMVDEADVCLIASDGRNYGVAACALAHATLFSKKPVYWVNPKDRQADWIMPQDN